MPRLSALRWMLLACMLGLSAVSSWIWLATHQDMIFPVDGWFFGAFADFKSFWLAGRLMAEHRLDVLFDPVAFNAERQRYFPFDRAHIWSYPLHVLLVARPLSWLGYPAAATLWMLAGGLALLAVIRRQGRDWPAAALVVALSGATFFWFYLGQLSPFSALLLVTAALAAPRRPLLAGFCLGILSIKPQLAAPLALLLLLHGCWRPLAVAALVTLAMVAATALLIGLEPWIGLIRDAAPVQREVMFQWRPVQPLISTPYAAAFALRQPQVLAWGLQACLSLSALAGLVFVARSRLDWQEKVRFTIVATVAGLPYVLVYDHLLLFPVLLPLLLDPRQPFWQFAVLAAALTLQGVGVLALVAFGIPLNAVLMALLLVAALARVRTLLAAAAPGRIRPPTVSLEAAA